MKIYDLSEFKRFVQLWITRGNDPLELVSSIENVLQTVWKVHGIFQDSEFKCKNCKFYSGPSSKCTKHEIVVSEDTGCDPSRESGITMDALFTEGGMDCL